MRGIAELFFEEECVAKLESSKFDDCGIDVLEGLLEDYLGGFRVESFTLDNAIEFYKSAGKLKYKELAVDEEVFGEDVVPYVKEGIAKRREEKRSAAEQAKRDAEQAETERAAAKAQAEKERLAAKEVRENNGCVDAAVEEEYMKMEV